MRKYFNCCQLKLLKISIKKIEKRREYVRNYQKSDKFKENRKKRILVKRKLSLITINDKSYGAPILSCGCKGGNLYKICSTKRCKCRSSNTGCNETCIAANFDITLVWFLDKNCGIPYYLLLLSILHFIGYHSLHCRVVVIPTLIVYIILMQLTSSSLEIRVYS